MIYAGFSIYVKCPIADESTADDNPQLTVMNFTIFAVLQAVETMVMEALF